MTIKTATPEDFKVGLVLGSEYGEMTLLSKYDEGIWEARCKGGIKCVFECEAQFYTITE